MSKRQSNRYTRRLETVFTTATDTFRGVTSDISEGGLFIRTMYVLATGSILGIEIRLPDGTVSRLKGRVKRAIRTAISNFKNGMGIEIIEKDATYIGLVKTMEEEGKGTGEFSSHESSRDDVSIVKCQGCGARNKVRAIPDRIPKCGKCGIPLIREGKTQQIEYFVLMCSNCRAKNKVASTKLSLNPRCGRCGTALKKEDMV